MRMYIVAAGVKEGYKIDETMNAEDNSYRNEFEVSTCLYGTTMCVSYCA